MKRAVIVIILALVALVSPPALSASYPTVRNFTPDTHGGGSQTWAIVSASNGLMYFGNKNGLLSFDSNAWTLTGVENGSTVRSLLLDEKNNRLYVGASEEFGYFTADSVTGESVYHNLSSQLPDKYKPFREVWKILSLEGSNSVWFQSHNCIFCYNGSAINAIAVNDRITASAAVNGRIYIATSRGSFGELRGDRVIDINADALNGARVCAILPYNKSVLLVTDFQGLFILESGTIRHLPTDIDDFLCRNQVFCAAASPDGFFAFGTVSKGAVIKNFQDGKTFYSNLKTGLQNNTVLSASFDADGNLWLGLDNGIDLVNVNTPLKSLLGTGSSHGAGYMSLRVGDLLYLGTNQGLFAMEFAETPAPDPPVLTPILRGQIWDIAAIGNDVFVCSDAGVATGNGLNFKYLRDRNGNQLPGAWAAKQLDGYPGYALVSTYESFYLLKRENGTWQALGKVDGYNDIGGHFSEDNAGNIWISHWLKGIYCLTIDPETRRFTRSKFYDSTSGLPTNRNIAVAIIDGQPRFMSEGGFFRLSPDRAAMVVDSTLNNTFGAAIAPRIHVSPDGDIWCIAGNSVSVARHTPDGNTVIDSLTYATIADRIIPGFDNFNFINSQRLIVSVQEGFYDIDLSRPYEAMSPNGVFFKTLQLQGDTTITYCPMRMSSEITIPYDLNSLLFEAVAPEYRVARVVLYSFYLENYDSDWSPWTASSAKEYTQLHEGRYTMHVKALNPFTHTIDERVLHFSVLPPWFRSVPAKVVYMLLTLLLMYLGFKAVRSISLRASRNVANRKEAEMEAVRRHAKEVALLKDYEIAELKGRQLEQDIKHKTEELSNITMNVVRKNEILLDISNRLDKLSGSELAPDVQRQIVRIKSIIRENISHDDDWRTFMHNFDAAYEDFTKNLQTRHPGLTPTELRICCYLKMGLSSKEIAPLFNISYRSVEMTRYRLRKKLELTRDISLTDYLQNLA